MIDLVAADKLLDFSSRIGKGQRAQEQLTGAVALHNLLEENGVAYLADEVGMGKTYAALGVIALYRHYHPSFRVIVIAPRENIQMKWIKEFRNFVANNVRFHDLRVKGVDGRPARKLVACDRLLDLVRETSLDPDRDFFLRLTSFSLPLAGKEDVDPSDVRRLRDELRRYVPWLSDEIFDLRRRKQEFKDNISRAINCALPVFDLVILDEGHNLKHGLSDYVAARNRVLAFVFGHPEGKGGELFPSYGPRAKRVLFLSATPVEETYKHLWNQLHVFGQGGPYEELKNELASEDKKKAIVRRFLIRRVTSIKVNGEELTKNQYRREWRHGGVISHDDPIKIEDDRRRLIVALVQKKVAEIMGREDFKPYFQIGMLASFESFLETAKLAKAEDDAGNFDDPEQTEEPKEREGIDVADINSISHDYRNRFKSEMPHPKMDEVVGSLGSSWETGKKTLIFVRRVASVIELKRKLDERYNEWLFRRLRQELPTGVQPRLEEMIKDYIEERNSYYRRGSSYKDGDFPRRDPDEGGDDGAPDTFFAWYFRGEGPRGIVSGANVQKRFIQKGTVYSTFFEDNHVASILGIEPGGVTAELARYLGIGEKKLNDELRERSGHFIGSAKRITRGERYEAAQAAAIEWLNQAQGPCKERAQLVWQQLFDQSRPTRPVREAPEIGDILETSTFFTELRKRPRLRERLWPEPKAETGKDIENFREQVLRAQLLAAAARLGHSFIDLYMMTIRRLGSLELGSQEDEEERGTTQLDGVQEYISILENQMETSPPERQWSAFDELESISKNFDLILDLNIPEVKTQAHSESSLSESSRKFGGLLRRQQPTAGMFGQVNRTSVRQFRMPGYPLVLITTDLLQEGEDLHSFCSSVHHYGISWTPSSMEQRIGRIDRVRSQTDRRLSALTRPVEDSEKLQVYYPHLRETVELLQVRRVIRRMNEFLRLMHEGLIFSTPEGKRIEVDREILESNDELQPEPLKLRSAFDIKEEYLHGETTELAVEHAGAEAIETRFKTLKDRMKSVINAVWEDSLIPNRLYGTAVLGERKHPFRLELGFIESRPLVRCLSPIGRIEGLEDLETVQQYVRNNPLRIGAVVTDDSELKADLTLEADVILGESEADDPKRVGEMVRRVTHEADRIENVLRGNDELGVPDILDNLDQESGADD